MLPRADLLESIGVLLDCLRQAPTSKTSRSATASCRVQFGEIAGKHGTLTGQWPHPEAPPRARRCRRGHGLLRALWRGCTHVELERAHTSCSSSTSFVDKTSRRACRRCSSTEAILSSCPTRRLRERQRVKLALAALIKQQHNTAVPLFQRRLPSYEAGGVVALATAGRAALSS
jgi:hypothetical protein